MSLTTERIAPVRVPPDPDDGGGARRLRIRKQVSGWLFLTPLVAYLLLFYLYPLYKNVDLSIRDYTVRSFVQGGAEFSGFDNYRTVLSDPVFTSALWHTVLFVGFSLLLQYGLGLSLAVFFYRRFPLSSTLRALFLVPWLLPLIVVGSTWRWMLNSDAGVVNMFLRGFGFDNVGWLTSPTWSLVAVTIANVWVGIPFNLVLLYSGLQGINEDVYDAAAVDGANGWQRFWRITFPLLKPVSAITLLLGLVYTLKVFDIIWIMTNGGPDNSSTTLATWSYQLGFGSAIPKFGPGAAVGNMLILIAFVAGLLYLRFQRSVDE